MSKKVLLSVFYISAVFILNAQVRKIPASVTEAFRNRYPHAINVAWKDKISCFEADFQLNSSEMSVKFSSDGIWQGTEREITFAKLSEIVKDGFFKSKYADWEVKNITEVQTMAEPIQYKLIVKKGSLQKKNLLFSASGKLIKDGITL